jgi:hypothetical protein
LFFLREFISWMCNFLWEFLSWKYTEYSRSSSVEPPNFNLTNTVRNRTRFWTKSSMQLNVKNLKVLNLGIENAFLIINSWICKWIYFNIVNIENIVKVKLVLFRHSYTVQLHAWYPSTSTIIFWYNFHVKNDLPDNMVHWKYCW